MTQSTGVILIIVAILMFTALGCSVMALLTAMGLVS